MFYFLLLLLAADVPATHPLDRETVLRAMRKTLDARPERADANIEIVDLSHFPVPDGDIEFDWKGLTPPASGQGPARWRGFVRHDVDHTYSIWAVVRLTALCNRILAVQAIRPGDPITASQLQEEPYEGFPSEGCNGSVSNVIGKVATRTIQANTPITGVMLALPASVLKGEQAVAQYRDDQVSLTLPVIVERNGRIGDVIPVSNPVSHKILLAQVVGQGKVVIEGASRAAVPANGDKQ
jgi:flagella basal body P-ring formation protein FlgA